MLAQRRQGDILVPFQFQGKAGLKFSTGEVALPALYDATWRISPRLFGFRQGEQYGILSHTGRQVMACTLPALAVGFREITPAAVLECVAALGFGQLPPLQWVLGRLCYADVLWAEEITPQIWRAGRLRHVLSSGELVRIRPEQYADILPAATHAAEAAAIQQEVPMLAGSGNVYLLTTWQCAESSIVPPLLQQSAGENSNSVQAERWSAHRALRALLRACHVGPLANRPEEIFDWVPYDVLRLPTDTLRCCREHLRPYLDAHDPQLEARRWQLIYLAWLAANDGLHYYPESSNWVVAEPFVFGAGSFANQSVGELLDEYGLWDLTPVLREIGRFF